MGWIPEQRYRFLENEAILYVPVDFFGHGILNAKWAAEKADQAATSFGDVDVGNLVECHENRRK